MKSEESDLQKFVDHYFTSQKTKWEKNSKELPLDKSRLAIVRETSRNRHKDKKLKDKYEITQNDIDVLQLMNPRMNAAKYMDNIVGLYSKEQNFRPREDKNESMQLALQTKRFISNSTFNDMPSEEKLSRISESHVNQLQCDIKHQNHINRLREMCYSSLGRMIIQRKQTKKKVELTKANYHTRQYLLPHVQEQIQRLEQEQPDPNTKFYLIANANSRGINFEVQKMPQKLSKVLQFSKYREIVCTLNQIIQQTVYNYKQKVVAQRKISPVFIWLPLLLVIVITLLLINKLYFQSTGLQISCLLISMAIMIFLLMMSCHRFNQKAVYISLIDRINNNITQYLNYLNSRPSARLYWKTAQHLYWIEISLFSQNSSRSLQSV